MGAGEQERDVQQRQAGRQLGPQLGEVAGTGAPQRHRQLGGIEHRLHRPADGVGQRRGQHGLPQRMEDLLLAPTEQLGQHLVHHHGGQVHVGLGPQPLGQLQRLGDGHLLGHGDDDGRRHQRVAEDVDHPAGLVAHPAHLHQLVDGLGSGELADHVTGRRRVDHDEVVGALAHLVAELAHREDLLDPRRGVGHEVERAGQRADAPQQRHLELEAQVLLERLLGVHGHAAEVGRQLAGVEVEGTRLERVGQVALGVDLAHQRPLAPLGGQQGQRGGDARLAHTALARHEDQAAIEQVDAVRVHGRLRRSPRR